jgi:hypothetical protein
MSNIMPMAAGCSVTDARGVALHRASVKSPRHRHTKQKLTARSAFQQETEAVQRAVWRGGERQTLRQGYSPLQLRQMLFLHQSQPCEASNGTLHQPPPPTHFDFLLQTWGLGRRNAAIWTHSQFFEPDLNRDAGTGFVQFPDLD